VLEVYRRPYESQEALPPADAWRFLDRLESHYTPSIAVGLDAAEVELSLFTRQCLNRRITGFGNTPP